MKKSKNIIDLIEPGDYVNGLEVMQISSEYWIYCGFNDDWTKQVPIHKSEIKSIVTKEQFASMEYKIEAEE